MPLRTFKAYVRLPDGTLNEVRIQAANPTSAQALLQAQYGRGCIVGFEELIQRSG